MIAYSMISQYMYMPIVKTFQISHIIIIIITNRTAGLATDCLLSIGYIYMLDRHDRPTTDFSDERLNSKYGRLVVMRKS